MTEREDTSVKTEHQCQGRARMLGCGWCGGVKHGELLEDALRREVKEEYGVDILEHEYLGFREVHRIKDGAPTHWIIFDFKVWIDPSCCAIGDPDKMDGIAWHTLDDLPSPMHSQWPVYLEKYKSQLIP